MTTLPLRKAALRTMLNALGEEITFRGVPLKVLPNRAPADQPFDRIDITVHVDDLTSAPAYRDAAIIDGTTYHVVSEGNTRPRNMGDRWVVPLGHGESASQSKFKEGRV